MRVLVCDEKWWLCARTCMSTVNRGWVLHVCMSICLCVLGMQLCACVYVLACLTGVPHHVYEKCNNVNHEVNDAFS